MISAAPFKPDYVIPPGEILTEYLESLGMTQRDLAARTGLTSKTVNEIAQGKAPIKADTALKLERVLGRPAHFWQNLDSLYREACVRQEEQERLGGSLDWLKRLPVKEMVRLGWLPKAEDTVGQLDAVLRFFGVSSVDRWSAVWDGQRVAYRRSTPFEAHPEAVSAWLRQGGNRGKAYCHGALRQGPLQRGAGAGTHADTRAAGTVPAADHQVVRLGRSRRCVRAGTAQDRRVRRHSLVDA